MATTPIQPRPPGEPPSPIQTQPRAVQITAKEVQPTLRLYTQVEDVFQVTVQANFAPATIAFQFRWLMPDGQIIQQTNLVTALVAGVITSLQIAVPEGFLLTAAMSAPTLLLPGQWLRGAVAILRGGIQGQNTFDEFLNGYVKHVVSPSWPEWTPQRPTDGAGEIVSIQTANPAAGQDFTITVPTNRRWNLLSLRAVLSASAAVANRFPGIFLDDGTNTFYDLQVGAAVTASANGRLVAAPTLPFVNDGQLTQTLPLPGPTFMLSGYHIKSNTIGIQAADQWNSIELLVQEWLDLQ